MGGYLSSPFRGSGTQSATEKAAIVEVKEAIAEGAEVVEGPGSKVTAAGTTNGGHQDELNGEAQANVGIPTAPTVLEASCTEATEIEHSADDVDEELAKLSRDDEDATEEELEEESEINDDVSNEEQMTTNGKVAKPQFVCTYHGCEEEYARQVDLLGHIARRHSELYPKNDEQMEEELPSSCDAEVEILTQLQVPQTTSPRKRKISGSSSVDSDKGSVASRRSSRSAGSRSDMTDPEGMFFYYGRGSGGGKRQRTSANNGNGEGQQESDGQQSSPLKGSRKRGSKAAKVTGFACEHPGCGKSFTSAGYLQRHNFVHVDEKDWPFSCVGCLRKFYRNDLLRDHQRRNNCAPKAGPVGGGLIVN